MSKRNELIKEIRGILAKPQDEHCIEYSNKLYRPMDFDLIKLKPLSHAKGIDVRKKYEQQVYKIRDVYIHF